MSDWQDATATPMPKPRKTLKLRLRVRRLLWLPFLWAYDRGWDEGLGVAIHALEDLVEKADGAHVAVADVRGVTTRLRIEVEH